jgi:hypothetical protein
VFSAGSSPTQEKTSAAAAACATATTPPKLGSKDAVPFTLTAAGEKCNPLKRYVDKAVATAPVPAATSGVLIPKSTLVRSLGQPKMQAPSQRTRTAVKSGDSDNELSFADRVPDCEPVRARGAGVTYSLPTLHALHAQKS